MPADTTITGISQIPQGFGRGAGGNPSILNPDPKGTGSFISSGAS
jgi:hypothetical protein